MNSQAGLSTTTDVDGSPQDLFALTDEQILEIEPQQEASSRSASALPTEIASSASGDRVEAVAAPTGVPSQFSASVEPPAWLAAQMRDPWAGPEAKEFWDGVQQARSEAAAYRAAIASPEDARALKELYPGGVNEARTVAERARMLDDVDRAYFGATGNSAEQTSISRTQLAQRMLREDPAAFREMVEAGIKVLQEAAGAEGQSQRSIASAISDRPGNDRVSGNGPSVSNHASFGNDASSVVAQHAVPLQGKRPHATTSVGTQADGQVAAYAAFERAANEDLERSVGGAIGRALAQALPVGERNYSGGQAGSQGAAPLRERLAASVRGEVERALQGDRQLGEQVAQIVASRRFDNDTRAQIVRLIGERAQQLVPGAAKRVLNEWTQTTLAAHRGRTQRDDSAAGRADVAQPSAPARAASDDAQGHSRRPDAARSAAGSTTRVQPVNYRKLSDEQILGM
jgi:hypothetical protein